jgi:hypothetical protein
MPKVVDEILMSEYQIRVMNRKNVGYYVYYCVRESCFKMKVGFKLLNFEVCSDDRKVN